MPRVKMTVTIIINHSDDEAFCTLGLYVTFVTLFSIFFYNAITVLNDHTYIVIIIETKVCHYLSI